MTDDEPTWKRYWGWSKTQQGRWDRCRKRYWFASIRRYDFPYGSVEAEEFRFLNGLSTVPQLVGKAVHEAIEDQIRIHRLSRTVSADDARRHVEQAFDEVRDAPDKHLVEAVNGVHVPDLAEARDRALSCVDVFFDDVWPRYAGREYVTHEEFEEMTLDGIRVILKPDLVTRADGGLVVTDWKTGSHRGDVDEDLQLGTYLLWATKNYDVPADDAAGERVSLADGTVQTTRRSREDLAAVRDRIVDEGRTMLAADAFPADPGEDRCRGCPFATVCEEGREHLPSGAGSPFRG